MVAKGTVLFFWVGALSDTISPQHAMLPYLQPNDQAMVLDIEHGFIFERSNSITQRCLIQESFCTYVILHQLEINLEKWI